VGTTDWPQISLLMLGSMTPNSQAQVATVGDFGTNIMYISRI